MPTGFDQAFRRVKELVANFRANETIYLSPEYQEQEARRDFIDKFWIALGWDVNQDTQKNPLEQEVKVERKEHGNSQRRADYAFYLHPNYRDVRFYVEAKKPYGDIATKDNYFQINRYGWSGRTKIGVLHDFEQFEIVDCRFKPDIDKSLSRNIRKYRYPDYEDAEKFAEIYWIFSREAVGGGSLEKFIATLPKKRAKDVEPGEMDDSFLKLLDQLRDELAHALKNKNPKLDGETLTEITQRVLDRFVFTRFLEDKFIEPQRIISTFGSKGTAWDDFIAASHRLNKIYNGVVYKPNGWLDEKVKIDDDAFSEICQKFSHVDSPYDFNEIPIHILGSIYERFLGKVITATDKRARVEEKPEVRKAGGVYYTPEYIVRYIVENTVGKLIEGRTPEKVAEMRVADIACGSGSFLLGVYDLLIRWHTRYYNENRDKAKIAGKDKRKEHKADVEEREDGLHLTLYKKREILLNNIYGVDIDPQAVEVAQLSLYLKLLQDETPGSARQYYLDFEQQALLPPLNKNITCGNSLIGTDISDGQLFASDEEKKLNPMDFEQRFPHIFRKRPLNPAFSPSGGEGVRRTDEGELHDAASVGDIDDIAHGVPLHGKFSYKDKKMPKAAPPALPELEGGFDAIVGNPPYVRQESLSTIKKYLESHYESFDGIADLYTYFMERSLRLLKTGGLFSYIVSSSFLRATYGEPLRRHLKQVGTIQRLVDFGGLPVFANAKDTYVCIPLISKAAKVNPPRIEVCKIPSLEIQNLTPYVAEHSFSIPAERFSNEAWALKSDAEAAVFENIMQVGRRPLGEYVDRKMFYGLKTGLNEAFALTTQQRREITKQSPASAPLIKSFLGGEDIRRYYIEDGGKLMIVIPCGWTRAEMAKGKQTAVKTSEKQAWEWMKQNHSGVTRHLAQFETALRKRQDQGEYWWELRPCDYYSYLEAPKIIFPDICKNPRFYVDRSGIYLANTAYCLGSDSLYLLGLLNSRLFWFAISNISIPFGIRAGEYRYRLIYQYMEKVPIRPVDLTDDADKAKHDRMVELVEQMLAARKQLGAAQSERDKDFYTHRCDGLDRQIDALVYDLYALTPAEVKIVEGENKNPVGPPLSNPPV